MQHITTPLKNLIDREQQWKLTLLEQWPAIVNNFSTTATIILLKVTSNSVVIGVPHPIWAQELSFSIPFIKTTINNLLHENKITDIYIKVVSQAPLPKKLTTFDKAPQNLQNAAKNLYPLTSSEQQCLEHISDFALKNNIQQFLMRCKKFRKENE